MIAELLTTINYYGMNCILFNLMNLKSYYKLLSKFRA